MKQIVILNKLNNPISFYKLNFPPEPLWSVNHTQNVFCRMRLETLPLPTSLKARKIFEIGG